MAQFSVDCGYSENPAVKTLILINLFIKKETFLVRRLQTSRLVQKIHSS